jgi:hypothetical protein
MDRRTPASAAGSLGTSSRSPGERPRVALDAAPFTEREGTGDDIGETTRLSLRTHQVGRHAQARASS